MPLARVTHAARTPSSTARAVRLPPTLRCVSPASSDYTAAVACASAARVPISRGMRRRGRRMRDVRAGCTWCVIFPLPRALVYPPSTLTSSTFHRAPSPRLFTALLPPARSISSPSHSRLALLMRCIPLLMRRTDQALVRAGRSTTWDFSAMRRSGRPSPVSAITACVSACATCYRAAALPRSYAQADLRRATLAGTQRSGRPPSLPALRTPSPFYGVRLRRECDAAPASAVTPRSAHPPVRACRPTARSTRPRPPSPCASPAAPRCSRPAHPRLDLARARARARARAGREDGREHTNVRLWRDRTRS
ncbi:hypothetical protein B0H17DRAFT_207542 [Mycena rosella]|uniref:Uncharacterized protein n=1 Tax=Mycena rosella TaxID=1033263 RepID=A0AAD7G899_MYCRO|nr:hypothetical protein B0H17DRAFT_207542 [Mycena rosella]